MNKGKTNSKQFMTRLFNASTLRGIATEEGSTLPRFHALRYVCLVLCGSFLIAALLTGCGEKKPTVDVDTQVQILKGAEASKKPEALTALAQMKEDAAPAVPVLIETLKDPDPLNRRLAAYALGEIGKPAASAVPALRNLLTETDRDVVTSALNAIRAIDPNSPEAKENLPNVATP